MPQDIQEKGESGVLQDTQEKGEGGVLQGSQEKGESGVSYEAEVGFGIA